MPSFSASLGVSSNVRPGGTGRCSITCVRICGLFPKAKYSLTPHGRTELPTPIVPGSITMSQFVRRP